MAELESRVTGKPEPGEKGMTTRDVAEWLDEISAHGDDGLSVVKVSRAAGGTLRRIWADTSGPVNAVADWDMLAAQAPGLDDHDPYTELPAGDERLALPPAEADAQQTDVMAVGDYPPPDGSQRVEDMPPPPARQQRVGARHRRK